MNVDLKIKINIMFDHPKLYMILLIYILQM